MTFTKRVFFIISLLTTLTIIFQVSNAANPPNPPMSKSEITVNDTNNNSQIIIQKGNTMIVELLTNPGTGYSWQIIKNDPDKLKPVGDSVLKPLDTEAPGASENQVFQFLAQNSGSTVLELHYLRPWERNLPPLKTYRINVQIR